MGNCWTCFKSSTENTAGDCVTNTAERTANDNRDATERGETDELLITNSPVHMTNLHTSSGFLTRPVALLNGNANTMGDIIGTIKDSQQVSDHTLLAMYQRYKDQQEDAILSEGIERLCCDLRYKPDDFAILVLAWRLDASQMCRFTRQEFVQGLRNLNADSVDGVRTRLEQTVEKLKEDSELFKQLYRFTFGFGLEPGHRTLSLDMAIILWRLVFTVHTPKLLDRWLYFLAQHAQIRGVPKDTWNMFLNFAETCDITSYNDEEAWPSLFDDFVEYENDRANQNVPEKPDEEDTRQQTLHMDGSL
uniref:Defective in cullin neddylation protein n=1 Tax=Phlebotomus kandelakii TaxID=1109342 RepID=A0A6B2EA02_9DIPT